MTTPDPSLIGERRQLISLAYRLLGSLADAEDVVQETYARWYAMPDEERQAIEVPAAWLTKVAGRICLDLLGSARARRERYVGSGSRSRCPNVRTGSPPTPPTRLIASPSTSRSAWPSSSWSSR
ncbi:sigma factor [Nonomuraea salmonea]|uniref:sigma factor n=1 Tax=Nonomuraea salmonea TaxID=46181 RepID=UPI002FE8A983